MLHNRIEDLWLCTEQAGWRTSFHKEKGNNFNPTFEKESFPKQTLAKQQPTSCFWESIFYSSLSSLYSLLFKWDNVIPGKGRIGGTENHKIKIPNLQQPRALTTARGRENVIMPYARRCCLNCSLQMPCLFIFQYFLYLMWSLSITKCARQPWQGKKVVNNSMCCVK